MKIEHLVVPASVFPLLGQADGDGFGLGSIIIYILVGIVVGFLARFLIPGRHPMRLVGTIVVGIIGTVLGGWLAGNVFEETEGVDWLVSIMVAVVLVLLLRMFSRRRA